MLDLKIVKVRVIEPKIGFLPDNCNFFTAIFLLKFLRVFRSDSLSKNFCKIILNNLPTLYLFELDKNS